MDLTSLKGLTIYIGRESGTDKLLTYTIQNGQTTSVSVGQEGIVPHSVSRALPTQQKAHVSIVIDNSGDLTLKNLKSENITLVNGSPIISKRISISDKIELGADHFIIPLELVLNSLSMKFSNTVSSQIHQKKEIRTYKISHLKRVWDNYHEGDLEIADKQHKIGLQQRIPIFFTIGAGALTSVAWSLGWGEWIKIVSICLTAIGIFLMAYFFMQSSKFNPRRETDKLREDFQSKYICPNPECKRFLGNYSYTMMKNQYKMECPYCKSKFTEK